MENHWCDPQKVTEYGSLDAAKDACNSDVDCSMFYQLESINETFVLCGSVYTIKQSKSFNSRLYKKCKRKSLVLILKYKVVKCYTVNTLFEGCFVLFVILLRRE